MIANGCDAIPFLTLDLALVVPFGTNEPVDPIDVRVVPFTAFPTLVAFPDVALEFSFVFSGEIFEGVTILTSPIFDLSSNQMYSLSYYSWFQNNFPWGGGANDTLTVKISNGTTLVELETMTSASPDLGQWNLRTFDLDQYIPLTSTMQLIIEIADWDYNGGHWVEGGFDMFQITSSSPTEIQQQSIEENSKIIKVVDVLGRELDPIKNTSLFYMIINKFKIAFY